MKQYLGIMQEILDHGIKKEDRTGTGTLSIFGTQSRYDLSEGFPLVTMNGQTLKQVTWVQFMVSNGVSGNPVV